jgi:hypothetical protein
LKRVSSWIHLGSFLVGRTTPTDNSAAGASVASGAAGASVGVAPQADRTIAATNKIAIKAYGKLFLNTITPP